MMINGGRILKKKELRQTAEWQNKKTDIRKLERKFRNILILTLVVVAAMSAMGHYLMKRYTTTIMNVYATQQDNYVQLVLDQINLQENGTEESIISDIIETLDSGNTHYWTLSKEENILFVKNVTETDKYQGASLDEFYDTGSADEFVKSLRLNHVTHELIKMDGSLYVASGVIFSYNDTQYTLCLLTDETVILDNNEFLSTRISMYIYVIIIMVLMLLVAMVAEMTVKKRELDNNLLHSRLELQNQHIERLEREAKERDAYDTRLNLYQEAALPAFARKLDEKNVDQAVVAVLRFTTETDTKQFLADSMTKLDDEILRFKKDETGIILLMCHYTYEMAWRVIHNVGAIDQIRHMEDIKESKKTITEACAEAEEKEW